MNFRIRLSISAKKKVTGNLIGIVLNLWVNLRNIINIKIAGKNINNLRYSDDNILTAESEEELKSLLTKVRGGWKSGLKLNIQKTKIMASSPITSWQIDGETMETERDLSFWAPKSLQLVTAAMKL